MNLYILYKYVHIFIITAHQKRKKILKAMENKKHAKNLGKM